MKPNTSHKCQCQLTATLKPEMASWYDTETELPFVNHKSNQCKCKNELKQYLLKSKKVWLCSNCTHQGETEL